MIPLLSNRSTSCQDMVRLDCNLLTTPERYTRYGTTKKIMREFLDIAWNYQTHVRLVRLILEEVSMKHDEQNVRLK